MSLSELFFIIQSKVFQSWVTNIFQKQKTILKNIINLIINI